MSFSTPADASVTPPENFRAGAIGCAEDERGRVAPAPARQDAPGCA
ncbi:MAG TPA: hypothetical protein VEY11_15965 [Pyrinomonadaceae bacterium]|nr:hypothetical protein [Pyrinomonadaceae bacterium]